MNGKHACQKSIISQVINKIKNFLPLTLLWQMIWQNWYRQFLHSVVFMEVLNPKSKPFFWEQAEILHTPQHQSTLKKWDFDFKIELSFIKPNTEHNDSEIHLFKKKT